MAFNIVCFVSPYKMAGFLDSRKQILYLNFILAYGLKKGLINKVDVGSFKC